MTPLPISNTHIIVVGSIMSEIKQTALVETWTSSCSVWWRGVVFWNGCRLDPATWRHDNPSRRQQAFTSQPERSAAAAHITAGHNVSSQTDCSSVSTVTPNSRSVSTVSRPVPIHPAFWRHYANHIHLYEGQETVELYLHNDTEADNEVSLLPLTWVEAVQVVIFLCCSV